MVGDELRRLGLHGIGVELGTQRGLYTENVLKSWQQAELYVQVDIWASQLNYVDIANVKDEAHLRFMQEAAGIGKAMVEKGYAKEVRQCRNWTTVCTAQFEDGSLDFIYVDARHDRRGVLEDLQAAWPKLKPGGIIAGHDYLEQWEVTQDIGKQNWTVNGDGSVDTSGRVVKGAVDDFFSGIPGLAPKDLQECPQQVTVTHGERTMNTWLVRKDFPRQAGAVCCAPAAAFQAFRTRGDLGSELQRVGLRGVGVELGVNQANFDFTKKLLAGWSQAELYVLVEAWEQEPRIPEAVTAEVARAAVEMGHAKVVRRCSGKGKQCVQELHNGTLDFIFLGADVALPKLTNGSVDFLVYLWAKLRRGGVLAGSRYNRFYTNVNLFFSGEAPNAPEDLRRCPRQVFVSYRDRGIGSTWAARK